ncbi:DegT/DnrJ/EryC1/StrS aminotransferase family protein [Candidatus Pelagibacter sp.]|jgi:dTDP-4-amino-4,6-dideoxygalactose transaminase|nr:DegT/DnrJ/EryC1/StrS aminotransferase family protein [Candidatus Pelagibacter sp.]|tara:strand:+ start:209 stop:1357 length:1149 start_codon:yes stop_codon:yes gene_type:complete
MKYIPYGRQFIDNKDKKLISSSLSNDLITTGPFVEKFERNLSKYFNCKYSYVCSSGTAAIHLAMLSVGLKKDDIILMPAVNFIAAYNMAKIIGLKVFLVDVDEFTGQVTPNKVLECIKKNKLKKIHALLVMFHGGYPENIKKFYDIKKRYNFYIIEDACHALGAKYKYKNKLFKIGSCKHADISTFSLHPLKTITSGEGGIVTSNNAKIAKSIQLFRSHGILRKKNKHWEYDILEYGFNYRLSDINCALGLSQLKKINFFLKKRKKIYQQYSKEFKNFSQNIVIPKYSKNIESSYHLFLLNIAFNKLKKNKNHFMKYLKDNKIVAQQHYIPIYKFSIYKGKSIGFSGAEKYFNNSISLPIFVNLSNINQIKVIKIIKRYFKQ